MTTARDTDWRWKEERKGTVEEGEKRETDGIMGRQRVLQAERKGYPRDLAVVYQN